MGWFGDFIDFEQFNAGEMWRKIRQNPERLVIGAADPFSTWMWGSILGKKDDWDPIINQMGGPADDTWASANAAGINTGPAQQGHTVAQIIASIYGGGAAAGALGGAFGAAGGSGAGSAAGAGTATATNSVGPLASGYAYAGTNAAPMYGYLGAGSNMSYGVLNNATGMGSNMAQPAMAASSSMNWKQILDLASEYSKMQQKDQPEPMQPRQPAQTQRREMQMPRFGVDETDLYSKRRKRRGVLGDY